MRYHQWLAAIGMAGVIVVPPLSAQLPGRSAPGFALKTLDGGLDSLSHYTGHPLLINFWASWCKPCRSEMPFIIAAYRAHQREKFAVLAINLKDQEGSTKDVRKFVAEFQLPFPVLLDEKGKARRLYALRGVPTSIFVGSDGRVRAVHQGPITETVLQQRLTDILSIQH
jgi:thiol-disulfide isomerase/thioredoxin